MTQTIRRLVPSSDMRHGKVADGGVKTVKRLEWLVSISNGCQEIASDTLLVRQSSEEVSMLSIFDPCKPRLIGYCNFSSSPRRTMHDSVNIMNL